jgi:voltage-gated potassium channel
LVYSNSTSRFLTAVSLLCGLVVMGTTGYIVIEKANILDSLYMTIITISTVGFKEIHEFSNAGKIFTIILIIMSISIYAYSFTVITAFMLEGEISYFLLGYRSKIMRKMENHVIICGFGRNGQQVAKELESYNQPYIVIDQSHDTIMKNLTRKSIFLEGDATQDEVLLKANITKAKALISTLPVDADNLYVVLSARSLNPQLFIISRSSDDKTEAKLKFAGVNNIVMPEKVGGAHMASLVTKPDVIEFLEHLSIHGDEPTNLEEVICSYIPDSKPNKTINDLNIRMKTGANIIGLKTPEGKFILNPAPDTVVIPGSKFFILGTKEQRDKMKELLQEPVGAKKM